MRPGGVVLKPSASPSVPLLLHQQQLCNSNSNTTTNHLTTNLTNQQQIKMSAPNVDKPNEGIVGQISNSVTNAANYVSETIQGKGAEASKEANKRSSSPHSFIIEDQY